MGASHTQRIQKPKLSGGQQNQMKYIQKNEPDIPQVSYIQRPSSTSPSEEKNTNKLSQNPGVCKLPCQPHQLLKHDFQSILDIQYKNSATIPARQNQFFTLGSQQKQSLKQQRHLKQSKQKQNHMPPKISISFNNKQVKAIKQLPEVRPPKKFIIKKTKQSNSHRQMVEIKQNVYDQQEQPVKGVYTGKLTKNIYKQQAEQADVQELANVATTKSESIDLQQMISQQNRTTPLITSPRDNVILQFGKTKRCRVSRML